MDIDIRGIWRYKAARETCEGLRDAITAQAAVKEAAIAAKDAVIEQKDREAELAKAKIGQLRKERDDAQKATERAIDLFFAKRRSSRKSTLRRSKTSRRRQKSSTAAMRASRSIVR